jgi:NAD(P)H-quinone oxidoreductase subunit 4L
MTSSVITPPAIVAATATRYSIPVLVAYTLIVVALVAFYLVGVLTTNDQGTMLLSTLMGEKTAQFADPIVFLIIGVAGAAAIIQGRANPGLALSVGTAGGFIVLTALQEPLVRYLTFAAIIFAIGLYGMVVSRNAVRVLMSIELMLNAVNINMVAFARYVDPVNIKGQIFAIFILTVAAAEAAVGLAIVLAIYRNMATVDMERFNLLKW